METWECFWYHENDIQVVAVGDKDRYIDALVLSAECEKEMAKKTFENEEIENVFCFE